MMHPGQISLWDGSAAEPETQGSLPDGDRFDLVAVGGGYTGLSTALHAAAKGLSVLVIEAGRIGQGGSGRNVGLVNAAAWLPPGKLRDTLGPVYGPRFLERFSRAPAYVFDLIERHQIRCEATRSGTLHAAHAASGLRDLRARHAEWQRLGEPVDLLDRDAMAALTGTAAFHGGLLDRRAGTINPMGYCRGLARAAQAAGARIATGTAVTALRRAGPGPDADWRVETAQGAVLARHVVLGTNAYTGDLWPGLKRVFSTIHYLQVASDPLGPEAAHVLPGRQGLWDTGKIMFSLRRDMQDRLVIGTMGRVIGSAEQGLTRRWAERQVARLYPELRGLRFAEAWHGQIAMTPDHLPRVHRLDRGLWTAIGYNGRGITTGTVFGQAMADLLTGADPMDLPLPVTDMASVPRAGLTARFFDMAFTANQALRAVI